MSESTEVTVRSTEEQLIESAREGYAGDVDDLVVPRLKIAQSLTEEVKQKQAEEGELIHSLTGVSYGTSAELVVVQAFKGRQWKDRDGDGRLHSTGPDEPVVPWENHPCYGSHFVDCPDAEEAYRAAVRANERDWGKGPGIATTYNFVGLLIDPESGELETFPVRVSLARSAAKEGRNWFTMLNISRAPWDAVFQISTKEARSKRGEPYMAVSVKQTRKTTDAERAAAVSVAQLVLGGSVSYEAGNDEEGGYTPREPESTGGIEM